ncbi:pantoate--beta-alanine ligase [Acidihalobacter yilgarnensis]|uniref:Pantothenate synthetase n=1 Tax=Acidihalobacter yilgarnensis TaxID=2819280 RepID=A0A1D8IQ34_9GAMM|nr:pantoate--beta-alanine ligase [Acidihalobacter yilgarnensis]AOU98546.1 pantoate--beta-alanine ligase [Acidihalobacter yilgarnensis]
MRETGRPLELRSIVRGWRLQGERVALVPTMGNLHDGHRALIREARQRADRVVVSIFVNPLQFDRPEDLNSYPRTLEADRAILVRDGVDLLFSPDAETLYPGGLALATRVSVPGLGDILEGERRPGHFTGVATIVCKLFNLVQPDEAVFGEKDYQQLLLVRRMAADLDIPVRIHGVPVVRAEDGLALSSRNARLDEEARRRGAILYQSLGRAETLLRRGGAIETIERAATDALNRAGFKVEYVAIRHAEDLSSGSAGAAPLVILAAAWLGGVRLIDCLPVV